MNFDSAIVNIFGVYHEFWFFETRQPAQKHFVWAGSLYDTSRYVIAGTCFLPEVQSTISINRIQNHGFVLREL